MMEDLRERAIFGRIKAAKGYAKLAEAMTGALAGYVTIYKLPVEWVETAVNHGWKFTSEFQKIVVNGQSYFTKDEAEEICRVYLKHTDKALWPTLMGISPIMDRALARKLKRKP